MKLASTILGIGAFTLVICLLGAVAWVWACLCRLVGGAR